MKNAIPTTRGWVHPKTGELLKAQKMTQEKVDHLIGVQQPAPKVEEVVDVVYGAPTVEVEEVVEDDELDYDSMSTEDLLEIAEASGIEFASARPSKEAIIEALEDLE